MSIVPASQAEFNERFPQFSPEERHALYDTYLLMLSISAISLDKYVLFAEELLRNPLPHITAEKIKAGDMVMCDDNGHIVKWRPNVESVKLYGVATEDSQIVDDTQVVNVATKMRPDRGAQS